MENLVQTIAAWWLCHALFSKHCRFLLQWNLPFAVLWRRNNLISDLSLALFLVAGAYVAIYSSGSIGSGPHNTLPFSRFAILCTNFCNLLPMMAFVKSR